MKSCVIIGGAPINDYERIKKYISHKDYFIFCDSGLKHADKLNIKPSLIIGDFDSYEEPETDIETIVLPCEKDDTDTFFAVKEALKRGFEIFTIIGAVGGRLDHSLGNISMLLYLYNQNKKAVLIDDYSVMNIVGNEPEYINKDFLYFSLLNVDGDAKGINIENAKYPLKNATVNCEYSYCVSNELINDEPAKVYINDGKMLLVKIDKE